MPSSSPGLIYSILLDGSLPHPDLVVDQKGLSAEFLQKVSAEIRQKVFLHLFVLSVLLQKHYISAERPSFCRNLSFCRVKVLWRVIWYLI